MSPFCDALPVWALEFICCPITREPLRFADDQLVRALMSKQKQEMLVNALGVSCEGEFRSGLINASNTYFHIIRNGIPTLIPAEAIPLTAQSPIA